jgi:hypothetical protein
MFGSRRRLIVAGLLFLVGVIAMAFAVEPRGPSLSDRVAAQQGQRLTPADLRARAAYIQRLEEKYRPYGLAFFWTTTDAEREAIKRQIDLEYAEIERIRARGPFAAADAFVPALAAPHLILMAVAAALALQPLAFVLAAMAVMGAMHQAFAAEFGVYVDSPSEYYLGAVLAALALGVAAWFGAALWQRIRAAPQ